VRGDVIGPDEVGDLKTVGAGPFGIKRRVADDQQRPAGGGRAEQSVDCGLAAAVAQRRIVDRDRS